MQESLTPPKKFNQLGFNWRHYYSTCSEQVFLFNSLCQNEISLCVVKLKIQPFCFWKMFEFNYELENKLLVVGVAKTDIIVNKWGMFLVVSVNQYWLFIVQLTNVYECPRRWIQESISTILVKGLSHAYLLTDKDL